jgi:hypothetical protein
MRLKPEDIVTLSQNAAADPAHALKCELAGEVLRSSGRLRLRVTGWSMLPTVMPADILIVENVPGKIRRGDIVLFHRDQRIFAHRVVSTPVEGSGHIVTQGDGMPRPDPPVAVSELLGRVSQIVRNGRCLEPYTKLGVPGRAVAEMVRRSDSAAKLVVAAHDMRTQVAERLGF